MENLSLVGKKSGNEDLLSFYQIELSPDKRRGLDAAGLQKG
jgi:hypothetical protein